MKKTFAVVGIALVLGIAVMPAGVAYAQTTPQQPAQNANSPTFLDTALYVSSAVLNPGAFVGSQIGNAIGGTDTGSSNFVGAAQHAVETGLTCGASALTVGLLFSQSCMTAVLDDVVSFVLTVANTILYVVGSLLTFVVDRLVVNMGTYVNNQQASGIQYAWQVMRDLANIGIIGGLIATAIGTILQLANYNANKLLARLIIAALLVNFSYFFAGAIIDSSNYLAAQIYNNVVCTDQTNCSTANIADRFEALMPIRTWTSVLQINAIADSFTGGNSDENNGAGKQMFADLGILITVAISIFVFLSAVALLIGRFVALIFLLITSPFGIAGIAIPGASKYAKEWWEALFSQAFFAPVYFLLVGFSLRIIEASKGVFTSPGSSSSKSFGEILTFMVGAVFMLMALRVAKEMSAQSKRLADIYKASDKIAGWMPKAYTQGLKYVGAVASRNTVGLGAYKASTAFRDWMGTNVGEKGLKGKIASGLFVTGADRRIQEGLDKAKGTKFFGFSDYATEHKAQQERDTELGNVKREQLAIQKIEGKLNKSENDQLNALLQKQRTGKLNKEERDRMDELLKKGGLKHTSAAAAAKVEEERDKGNKRFLKNGDTYIDENGNEAVFREGKERYESDKEFLARQRLRNLKNGENPDGEEWGRRLKLNQDGSIKVNENGDYEWEDGTAYRQRIQKLKGVNNYQLLDKDGNPTRISYRNARAEVEAEGQKMPDGWLKRMYDKNPNQVAEIAPFLSHEQWNEFIKDGSVKRSIKNQARDARFGDYKRRVTELQDAVDSGDILEGGKEYNDRTLELFNVAKKDIKYADEWVDYITSTPGEGLRKKRALWQGSTTGFYKQARESGKLGAQELRNINSMKRPYLEPQYVWTGARMVLGETNELPEAKEGDAFDPKDDAKKWAKNTIRDAGAVIRNYEKPGSRVSIEDREKAEDNLILARLVATGKTIDDLTDAETTDIVKETRFADKDFKFNGKENKDVDSAEKRKKFFKEVARTKSDSAEESIVTFGDGKQVDEVAVMMQDRSMYHPAMANLTADKMMEVIQDTRFLESWLDNKLSRGSNAEVEQIITNDNVAAKFAWPTKKRIDEINSRRKIRYENLKKRREEEGQPFISEEDAELQALPYSPEEYLESQKTKIAKKNNPPAPPPPSTPRPPSSPPSGGGGGQGGGGSDIGTPGAPINTPPPPSPVSSSEPEPLAESAREASTGTTEATTTEYLQSDTELSPQEIFADLNNQPETSQNYLTTVNRIEGALSRISESELVEYVKQNPQQILKPEFISALRWDQIQSILQASPENVPVSLKRNILSQTEAYGKRNVRDMLETDQGTQIKNKFKSE